VDPADVLAQQVIALAQGVFAVTTELTLPAADSRGDCDPIAGFESRDVSSRFLDDARRVATGDMGHLQVDAREATTGVDVQVVERAGLDIDEDLPSIGFGIGEVAVLQYVGIAVLAELNGLHEGGLSG
jgi:hypothetical protein